MAASANTPKIAGDTARDSTRKMTIPAPCEKAKFSRFQMKPSRTAALTESFGLPAGLSAGVDDSLITAP